MDLNNIFNLFNDDIEETDSPEDSVSVLIDFSSHPFYWINGFNKIISNSEYFEKLIIKNFKISNPEDIQILKNKIMFEKAWDYIKNINIDNQFHIDCLYKKSSYLLMNNLNVTLDYFEKLEKYENCYIINQIKIKIEEFLGKK